MFFCLFDAVIQNGSLAHTEVAVTTATAYNDRFAAQCNICDILTATKFSTPSLATSFI